MKKTLKYLSVMLMGAFFVTSCEDLNKIDFGSADDAGDINVTYSQAGVEVKSLSFGSGSRLVATRRLPEPNDKDLTSTPACE